MSLPRVPPSACLLPEREGERESNSAWPILREIVAKGGGFCRSLCHAPPRALGQESMGRVAPTESHCKDTEFVWLNVRRCLWPPPTPPKTTRGPQPNATTAELRRNAAMRRSDPPTEPLHRATALPPTSTDPPPKTLGGLHEAAGLHLWPALQRCRTFRVAAALPTVVKGVLPPHRAPPPAMQSLAHDPLSLDIAHMFESVQQMPQACSLLGAQCRGKTLCGTEPTTELTKLDARRQVAISMQTSRKTSAAAPNSVRPRSPASTTIAHFSAQNSHTLRDWQRR